MTRITREKMNLVRATGLALALALPGAASASDYDGSKPLLCVPTDIVSCQGAGECQRMTAEEAGVAQFLMIDFAKRSARARRANGEERTVTIESPQKVDGGLVLHGLADGGERAYSLRIDEADGRLSVGIAGRGDGFVIFGACASTASAPSAE